jgi:hypothetical protein
VGSAASIVAVIPEVRAALLDFQRAFARKGPGAVLDGRDIGTVVCPEADVKLFITASPEVRAKRRQMELGATDYRTVLAEIKARDLRDSQRADGTAGGCGGCCDPRYVGDGYRAAIAAAVGRWRQGDRLKRPSHLSSSAQADGVDHYIAPCPARAFRLYGPRFRTWALMGFTNINRGHETPHIVSGLLWHFTACLGGASGFWNASRVCLPDPHFEQPGPCGTS